MLITDKIRNKTILDFPVPVAPEQVKHFREYFALAVLRYVNPEQYNDYDKSDRPDLQSKDKKRGVEVTTATATNDASIDGDYATYRLTDDDTRKALLGKRIIKHGGSIDSYGVTYTVKSSADEYRIIRDAIVHKNTKINDYKAKGFEYLELFVCFEEPLCPRTEEQMRNLFEETRTAQTYDLVYLCAPCTLITYQYSNKSCQIIPIAREDYECFGVIARMTLDGDLSLNSLVWTMSEEK